MNDIDAEVLHAICEWRQSHNDEIPAMVLVHPEMYKRMTCDCFTIGKFPPISPASFLRDSLTSQPLCISDYAHRVPVRRMETRYMSFLEYVMSKDIVKCLSELQAMYMLEAMPHLREIV